ncbi:hypothetical protein SAMN05421810_102232 [Amycolatopsis arida]|uniref:Uncharacterized protein n=2 Tax=Amycolatopsis arida TaxID=587909 RepID=A0A1I5PC25_9PSEU|nr:hypothetical protein CLV69_101232 [Amycolatopsis arida]SFP31533.1 hypothetical protein SAMN05421810_102232 [Amycolatopsis arida]
MGVAGTATVSAFVLAAGLAVVAGGTVGGNTTLGTGDISCGGSAPVTVTSDGADGVTGGRGTSSGCWTGRAACGASRSPT